MRALIIRGRRSRLVCSVACVLVGLLVLLSDAQARVRTVSPGTLPKLGVDEGLLLVSVDSSVDLDQVRVKKEGKWFTSGALSNLKAGRNVRLYVVPKGDYQWSSVSAYKVISYDLSDDPEYRFTVEPGLVTYGGDLVFRPTGLLTGHMQVSNRGLQAMDWLADNHPQLAAQFRFVYSGHYPDPFPDFYGAQIAKRSKNLPKPAFNAPPTPASLPLVIKELWRESEVYSVDLNGAGDLVALTLRKGEGWALELLDLKSGTQRLLANSPYMFTTVAWSGDRTLVSGIGVKGALQVLHVVQIKDARNGQRDFDTFMLRRPGKLVDALAEEPDRILIATVGKKGDWIVHRMDISTRKAVDSFITLREERLNKGVKDDFSWFADGNGQLRAIVVARDKERVLTYGSGETFDDVLTLKADGGFTPYALSRDGRLIYGLSDEGRGQRELVVFDPAQRRITDTLFSKTGVDVEEPILDSQRIPIGVVYYKNGRLRNEYFDAQQQSLTKALDSSFPGRTVTLAERNHDGTQWVLWVDSTAQPPELYHFDVTARQASLLAHAHPWLADKRFVASELVEVTSADGLRVEAFLTLPSAAGKRPLIVLPHGGPVGVADRLHFDPEVQFLASIGYAVLQVNFRGSAGYGKAFRQAGHHQHGGLIEDDIDAALQHVLARYPLDETRMCVVGTSYGGYSALVSAVRWPARFRCAVSIAGVSDRVLFFTASDGGRSAKGRESLERVIGDPRTQLEDMVATSPLYRYDEIRVPLMLVHGLEDRRVDYEHSLRMLRMLNLAGVTPTMLTFKDEGHGIESIDNIETMWTGIAGFLQQSLAEPSSRANTPDTSMQSQ